MIGPLCCYVFSNAETIPVYTDNRVISTFKKTIGFETNGVVKLYNLTTKISIKEKEKIQRYLNKLPLIGYKLNTQDIKELEDAGIL